jgi:hypothetical protein
VAKWVRLCRLSDAPPVGRVAESEVDRVAVCLANVNGELSALNNVCPRTGMVRWDRDGWRGTRLFVRGIRGRSMRGRDWRTIWRMSGLTCFRCG